VIKLRLIKKERIANENNNILKYPISLIIPFFLLIITNPMNIKIPMIGI